MILAALFLGAFIAAIGFIGVVAPQTLLAAVRPLVSPAGLWVAGAIRVVFGTVLVLVAASSRTPRALRLLGFLIVIAGLITPFVGADRARAMVDWWSGQGGLLIRGWAALAVVFGIFIVYGVAPHRPAAPRSRGRLE